MAWWAALILPAVVTGCVEPKAGVGDGGADEAEIRYGVRNPFEPERLVVLPLTRLMMRGPEGEPAIELLFELVDQYGHGVKALGTVAVELVRGSSARGGRHQVLVWNVDLTEPSRNAEPYDRVTRAYRIALTDLPDDMPAPEQLSLEVQFTSIEGTRVRGSYRLGSGGP